jgi:hypothetical protein
VGADVVEGMVVVADRVVTELVVVDAAAVGVVAVRGSVEQAVKSPSTTAESKACLQRSAMCVIV